MQYNKTWSVWIDKRNKTITIKESPNSKQIFFKNKEIGMKIITELISKGYKLG